MRLPDIKDFSWDGDENLDGNYGASYAWKHFGGKTPDQALEVFAEHFSYYAEDLLWMGRRAYDFYFPVAVGYLLGEGPALNDLDPAGLTLLHSVEHQYPHSEPPQAVAESAKQLRSLLDKWGVADSEDIIAQVEAEEVSGDCAADS